MLQCPVLASKLAPYPRCAPLVDLPHLQRSTTLEKSVVYSPSHRRQVVAGLIELRRHVHQTDTIADPQCAPRFVHPVQDTTRGSRPRKCAEAAENAEKMTSPRSPRSLRCFVAGTFYATGRTLVRHASPEGRLPQKQPHPAVVL